MHRKPLIALLVAAGLIAGGTVAGVVASGDDPSHQQVVAQRGARVMPFSLDATTHVFKATPQGERSASSPRTPPTPRTSGSSVRT
ncbi:MAG: hypothetical protein WKF73_19625 [Nocardioidaceae bacterium]